MTDYRKELAFYVPMSTEQSAFAIRLNDAGESGNFDGLPEEIHDLDLLTMCTFRYDAEAECLEIYSEESADVENLAVLLQLVQTHFGLQEPIAFEYAMTCSRPRTGAFGGGVMMVTKNEIKSIDTSDLKLDLLTAEYKRMASDRDAKLSLDELRRAWKALENVPVDDDGRIGIQFRHFPAHTPRETIWHWFEEQNPDFSVAEAQGVSGPKP